MIVFIARLRQRLRLASRRCRRYILVRVRKQLEIDEDLIRDALIEGQRRDQESLATTIVQTSDALSELNERVAFYEKHIPRMRDLREAYNKSKAKAHATRDAEVERQARANKEVSERRALGLLS